MTKPIIASAHCDVPCGIYEPTVAKLAARTVARMVDQILEMQRPSDRSDPSSLAPASYEGASKAAMDAYQQAITRRITVKEHHAEMVKQELETLWSDFFKPEHLTQFPDLHNKIWTAVKLSSTCKQEISKDHATELLLAVDEIAKMFYAAKGVPERLNAYREITDNLYR